MHLSAGSHNWIPHPLLYYPTWNSNTFIRVFCSLFSLLYTFLYLQMQPLCCCVFSLPSPPASHQSPSLVPSAERLWRWMRSFGIFYKGKCNKHTDYLLPRVINWHCNAPLTRKHLSLWQPKAPRVDASLPQGVLGSSCSPNPNGTYALMFNNNNRKKNTVAYVLKPGRIKHEIMTASAAFPR